MAMEGERERETALTKSAVPQSPVWKLLYVTGDVTDFMTSFALKKCLDARTALKLSSWQSGVELEIHAKCADP